MGFQDTGIYIMRHSNIGLLLPTSVLLTIASTSCNNDNEPSDLPQDNNKIIYSINPTDFPRNLIITSIDRINIDANGTERKGSTTEFEYDSNNRVVYVKSPLGGSYAHQYTWSENTCTVDDIGRNGNTYGNPYKGTFENSLLATAEWGKNTIQGVYDNGRLSKLNWNTDGNIESYENGRYRYTYSNLENCYNVDLNIFLATELRNAWDDDGSSSFTCLGYTGVRTSNLISAVDDTSNIEKDEIEYKMDTTGRIETITRTEYNEDGSVDKKCVYTIKYME